MLSQSKGGRVKNSIVSIVPYGAGGSHPGHVVLAASSYSRIGMIKSMARDHLSDRIRLNAICPAASFLGQNTI
jgi:NAD(P)-dependent dehydrogenase (short-subunit alcohol dehydrogenase family)